MGHHSRQIATELQIPAIVPRGWVRMSMSRYDKTKQKPIFWTFVKYINISYKKI
jgi:hypothetical protein